MVLHPLLVLNRQRLNIPDALRILIDAPIRAEEAHSRHALNALGDPALLVAVGLVNELLSLDVTVEVIRHEVEVAVVADGRDHAHEVVGLAEGALLDGLEHLDKVRVDRVRAVRMIVADVLDVFGEVTEEEDVLFANFAGDFDLGWVSERLNGMERGFAYVGTIASSDDETTVEDELHVTGTGGPVIG